MCVAGCDGVQSALAPAGDEASRIAVLFWGMTIGSAIIWIAVVTLAIYATYFGRGTLGGKQARRLIVGGGAVFPVVTLTGLLAYSLSTIPDFVGAAPAGTRQVRITGHQWWWRVRYEHGIELANELHLPAGEPVELVLDAHDVIHSFWVPSLGGKMDMIPGRQTRLVLRPVKHGVYRGTCAEYCGASHAWMSLVIVVEDRPAFERWLALQAAPSRRPGDPGEELFTATGCGACHAIRGTRADGVIGPDLTHVGGRRSLAAGALANDVESFRRFIARPHACKPGARMPHFHMLPADDLATLASYLEGLQ